MLTQDALAIHSDRTLREALMLYKLRDTTTKGSPARKAIEKDIRTKLGKARFSAYDKQAIQHYLDPYPSWRQASVELTDKQAQKLSALSLKLTGCRDIGVLMAQIVSGQRHIY
jgi:hypothetical protein